MIQAQPQRLVEILLVRREQNTRCSHVNLCAGGRHIMENKGILNISHLWVDVCSSCHLSVSHSSVSTNRSWEAAQYDSYPTTGFQEQTASPIAPLCIYPSTAWLPPLSLISPACAICVHSFSFPFFLLSPSSPQIIQSELTTKTRELPIATAGKLLVHTSYEWNRARPYLWPTQENSVTDGGTLSFNDNNSGTASLRVYSECGCTLPTEKMLTKRCLDASQIAVCVFVEGSGQEVRISLDNKNYNIKPLLYSQPAWTSEILDHTAPHDLVIIKQNPGGQYLALYYIIVTYYDPPTTSRDQVAATAPPASNTPNQLIPSTAIAAPPDTQTKSIVGALSSDRFLSDPSPE